MQYKNESEYYHYPWPCPEYLKNKTMKILIMFCNNFLLNSLFRSFQSIMNNINNIAHYYNRTII